MHTAHKQASTFMFPFLVHVQSASRKSAWTFMDLSKRRNPHKYSQHHRFNNCELHSLITIQMTNSRQQIIKNQSAICTSYNLTTRIQ